MITAIKRLEAWLNNHPQLKQWGWFTLLWCSGLLTAYALAYPIKWLIRTMQ